MIQDTKVTWRQSLKAQATPLKRQIKIPFLCIFVFTLKLAFLSKISLVISGQNNGTHTLLWHENCMPRCSLSKGCFNLKKLPTTTVLKNRSSVQKSLSVEKDGLLSVCFELSLRKIFKVAQTLCLMFPRGDSGDTAFYCCYICSCFPSEWSQFASITWQESPLFLQK